MVTKNICTKTWTKVQQSTLFTFYVYTLPNFYFVGSTFLQQQVFVNKSLGFYILYQSSWKKNVLTQCTLCGDISLSEAIPWLKSIWCLSWWNVKFLLFLMQIYDIQPRTNNLLSIISSLLDHHYSANTSCWKLPVLLTPLTTLSCLNPVMCSGADFSLPILLEGCQPQVTWPGRKNLGDFWDPFLVRHTFSLLLLAHNTSSMTDGSLYFERKAMNESRFASESIDPVQKHWLCQEKQMYVLIWYTYILF